MNPDLKQLIRLQTIDLAIQELRTRIDKVPGLSKSLDEKLRSATGGLEASRQKARNNQTNRKKLESEIGVTEAKMSKYREQMMAVKTNDEYRALQHEIEHAQSAIRKIEDEILNLMMDAESSQVDIKAAEARLKEDQRKVDQERTQLIEQNQRDLSALESYLKERKGLEISISSDLLPR